MPSAWNVVAMRSSTNRSALGYRLLAFGDAVERHFADGDPTEKAIQNGGGRLIFNPFSTFIGQDRGENAQDVDGRGDTLEVKFFTYICSLFWNQVLKDLGFETGTTWKYY